MKIAIDNRPLTSGDSVRGIGIHVRELVSALKKEEKKEKNIRLDVVDFNNTDLTKYNVVHFEYFHPHFLTLPFKKPTKKVVVTIHDLIRLIYPKAYPPGIRGKINFAIQKFNLRNVDAIITVSETSKKDIIRFLRFPSEKIHVIYNAPQSIKITKISKANLLETKNKYNLPDKFVLYVGDVNYNKNLLRLADACKKANVPLVMAGKQSVIEDVDNNIENLPWRKFLNKYKNDKEIIRLGFLENEEFEAVFMLATLYCQPSLYEGFGLPVLEAFQRDLPVVAARTQSLVEIGVDACTYADPHSAKDMSQKISELLNNKNAREKLIKLGRKRLTEFSWQKSAKDTINVYKKVFNGQK